MHHRTYRDSHSTGCTQNWSICCQSRGYMPIWNTNHQRQAAYHHMCAWALAVYSPKDYGITAGSICCGFLWKSEITPTLLKNPLSHPAHTSKPSRHTLVIGLLWRESRFLCIFHAQMLKYEQLFATETMTLTDDQWKHSTVPACSTEQASAPFLGCIQQHLFPLPALNE